MQRKEKTFIYERKEKNTLYAEEPQNSHIGAHSLFF